MVKLPCHTLEPDDPGRIFFGQQQILDAMQETLGPKDTGKHTRKGKYKYTHEDTGEYVRPPLRQFALCGPGGVGKTEAAAEFVRKNKDNFDAIFWVRADEAAKLDHCFAEISVKLGLETAEEATNQKFSRSLVRRWLEEPVKDNEYGSPEASWLLILDNVDDPRLLEGYLPIDGSSGSVLVTSRDPLVLQPYSENPYGIYCRVASSLNMEPLSDADGGALLLKLAGFDADAEANLEGTARDISRSLDGLPLAISQISEIIRRQGISLSEFQSMFEEDKHRIASVDTKHYATVWAMERLSAEAKGLLNLMLFMDPDVIQESILSDAAVLTFGSSFKLPKFNEACAELLQSPLIRRHESKTELSEYHISVHRLVQDATQSRMTGEEMQSTFATMVDFLWQTWHPAQPALPPPTKPSKTLQRQPTDPKYLIARWPLCLGLYPHVLQLKKLWPLISGCNESTKIRFAALLTKAAWYQQERGLLRHFDGFFDVAKSICESVPGDDSDAVLYHIHFCLGMIYAGTNEHKLAREHKEANMTLQLAVCRSVGPDFVDLRLALAYVQLAITLAQEEQLDESIAAFERGREIRRNLEPRKIVASDASHAMTLMLRGRPEDLETAEEMVLDSVKLWESTSRVSSPKIARHFQALGKLRFMQERFEESYNCDKKALSYFIDSMGVRSYRSADMRVKCAIYLMRKEIWHEASPLLNAAFDCWSPYGRLFLPELARNKWLKGKLMDKWADGRGILDYKSAVKLRRQFISDNKPLDGRQFAQEEFDCLVEYRSR